MEGGARGHKCNVCSGRAVPVRHVLDELVRLSTAPVSVVVDPVGSARRIPRSFLERRPHRTGIGWRCTSARRNSARHARLVARGTAGFRLIFAILARWRASCPPARRSGPTLRDIADTARREILGCPTRRLADHARYQEVRVRRPAKAVGALQVDAESVCGCSRRAACYARNYPAASRARNRRRVLVGDPGEDERRRALARELSRASWTREPSRSARRPPVSAHRGHYRIRSGRSSLSRKTPASIVTKGPMVVRDIDVLTIAARTGCSVSQRASVDEDAWARIEPGTAPPLKRLRAVRQLTDAGIRRRADDRSCGHTTTRQRRRCAPSLTRVPRVSDRASRGWIGCEGILRRFLRREYRRWWKRRPLYAGSRAGDRRSEVKHGQRTFGGSGYAARQGAS